MGITKTFSFDTLPTTVDELKALNKNGFKDEFETAALAVLAYNTFPANKDVCYEMVNYLKGPVDLSAYDKQFIRDRFMDSTYLARSYFKGATPANNYEPSKPYTLEISEQAHSRDQEGEGYVTLWLSSGGADSPRSIKLHKKASTGEWFLHEQFILVGIRKPAAEDPFA